MVKRFIKGDMNKAPAIINKTVKPKMTRKQQHGSRQSRIPIQDLLNNLKKNIYSHHLIWML